MNQSAASQPAHLEARDLGDVQREGRLGVGGGGEEASGLCAALLLRRLLVEVPVGPQAVAEEQGVDVRHELAARGLLDALEGHAGGEELWGMEAGRGRVLETRHGWLLAVVYMYIFHTQRVMHPPTSVSSRSSVGFTAFSSTARHCPGATSRAFIPLSSAITSACDPCTRCSSSASVHARPFSLGSWLPSSRLSASTLGLERLSCFEVC